MCSLCFQPPFPLSWKSSPLCSLPILPPRCWWRWTAGAAAAITICFKALCEAGDEFIAFAPFFPEYKPYVEGAGLTRIYLSIIVPMLRPAFLSVIVLLSYISIKSFDLVLALTNGGPGSATEMPSTFMFSATFLRNQMGVGAASAMMMLMTVAAIIIPYLYSELKEDQNGH